MSGYEIVPPETPEQAESRREKFAESVRRPTYTEGQARELARIHRSTRS